jgi:hypothetical protein
MALQHCNDLFDMLRQQWRESGWTQLVLALKPWKTDTWENGVVFGTFLTQAPSDIESAFRRALRKFDAWAILNTIGEWRESGGRGSLSTLANFFNKNQTSNRFFQIFISCRAGRRSERALALLRDALGSDDCVPVFYFRDGRIMLFRNTQPPNLLPTRLKPLLRNLNYVCGCDLDGGEFSTWGGPIWDDPDNLDEFWFTVANQENGTD